MPDGEGASPAGTCEGERKVLSRETAERILRRVVEDIEAGDPPGALARAKGYLALRDEVVRAIGSRGGRATVERHGRDHMQKAGKLGGEAVVERHGNEHMSRIGRKGAAALARAAEDSEEGSR